MPLRWTFLLCLFLPIGCQVPPVEVVLSIVTGIMLLAAVVLVDYAAGKSYGKGALFADSYSSGE